jgi:L-lactate dehydrogenase complex protein LldF
MDLAPGRAKGWVVNTFVPEWKAHRSALLFPKKSFSQQWRERQKAK